MSTVKGYALVFVLAMLALIMLSITAIFFITFNDLATSNTTSKNMKAYYLAEAGLAEKFMELRAGYDKSKPETPFTLVSNDSGTFSVDVPPPQGGIFIIYRLDSTGKYKNVSKKISLTLEQVAVSRYAYLTDVENRSGTAIWFLTGDILHGPVYTNDQLHVSGSPIFDGPVSTVNNRIDYYHGGPPTDNPDFRQSLTLGAPSIQLPTASYMINPIKTASQESGGLYLTGDTQITFLSNGTMNVVNSAKGWHQPTNTSLPTNGAIFVNNGYVDVSGTLKGSVTLATSEDIYVVNNLLYNTDPRQHTSTDMMGLVAQNNVYVDRNAPDNLEIDAYIVALNTSFAVENYQTGLKGTLTLYGGITQDVRGPVGTFDSRTNQRVSGYAKNYNYDSRLADAAPVCFPPAKDANGRIVYTKVSWVEY